MLEVGINTELAVLDLEIKLNLYTRVKDYVKMGRLSYLFFIFLQT